MYIYNYYIYIYVYIYIYIYIVPYYLLILELTGSAPKRLGSLEGYVLVITNTYLHIHT